MEDLAEKEENASLGKIFRTLWLHYLYHYAKVFGGVWIGFLLLELLYSIAKRLPFDATWKIGKVGLVFCGLAIFMTGCLAGIYTFEIWRARRKAAKQ